MYFYIVSSAAFWLPINIGPVKSLTTPINIGPVIDMTVEPETEAAKRNRSLCLKRADKLQNRPLRLPSSYG